jgi:Tfp pilus assembly protein PilF
MLAAALALGGCGSQPVKDLQRMFQSKGQPELEAGIQKYEDGKYVEAAARLQGALDEGLSAAEEVKAHKYLAFIHCASRREKQCRAEFRKALDKDPGFQLEASEAGHPIWGPVFRSVKERG